MELCNSSWNLHTQISKWLIHFWMSIILDMVIVCIPLFVMVWIQSTFIHDDEAAYPQGQAPATPWVAQSSKLVCRQVRSTLLGPKTVKPLSILGLVIAWILFFFVLVTATVGTLELHHSQTKDTLPSLHLHCVRKNIWLNGDPGPPLGNLRKNTNISPILLFGGKTETLPCWSNGNVVGRTFKFLLCDSIRSQCFGYGPL